METRQIISFMKIADLQGFSKAADDLGYSQSALTVQIRLLEQELGVRLFDRIGRQITLTSAGRQFRQHADNILKEMHAARLAAMETGEPDGLLRIGTIESLCSAEFPALLQRLRVNYPNIRLQITTGSPEELMQKLDTNQIDLLYILDRPLFQTHWVKVLEKQEDIVFVCSAGFLPDRKRVFYLHELLDYPFILTEQDANYRFELDQHLASLGLEIFPILEIRDTEFIIHQVRKGIGLSFLPRFAVSSRVASGELSVLEVADFSMSMQRQLFYHRDKWLTPEMEAMLHLFTTASDH